MLVVPAIDLKNGQCVRLRQGDMTQTTVFSDDPVSMVSHWRDLGARRLHIVDLDGAFAGTPVNAALIRRMVAAAGEMPVQVGGGIRDETTAKAYLDAGVSYTIIGTRAVQSPEFVTDLLRQAPDTVIVGLDSRAGRVSIDGWANDSGVDLLTLGKQFADAGVTAFIHTDIERDGMLDGVNVDASVELAKSSGVNVFASGGVKDLSDIERLIDAGKDGITGVIVGRSIYEGTLDFAKAQSLADRAIPC